MKLHKTITKETISKIPVTVGLLIGVSICCSVAIWSNYTMGLLLASIPIMLICGFYIFERPYITFFILFILNYFAMGVNRYISIPVGIVVDGVFVFLVASLLMKNCYKKIEWSRAINVMTWTSLVWLLYCLLQLTNNASEATPIDWLQGGRAMAIYPLVVVVVVSVLLKKYKDIQWFLIAWAAFTILAALKGYWQKNQGFDSAELAWLFSPGGGGSTHLISTGIRYFSFFTDAGNYGASMGFAMVVFLISSMYVPNKWIKGFFLIAGLAGGYGMMISGTRGALAAPFAGFILFVFISKNWKIILGGTFILLLAFSFFKFTTIGDSNNIIRRMRTGFSSNDASFQVRINNQNKMKSTMKELPFGLGIGTSPSTIGINNKYNIIAVTPPDSWL
ncbi:MAG: O-antigen ligase domain-containing protein, partial [Bacteroides sp.]